MAVTLHYMFNVTLYPTHNPFVRQAKRIVHRLSQPQRSKNCLWGKTGWLVFCVPRAEVGYSNGIPNFPIPNIYSSDYRVYIFN